MKEYQISVITICYNNLPDLFRTYNSISQYISKQIEWVVIDGSSDKEIYSFIQNINKDNINYLFETDNGIYDAMNKGIIRSNGNYLIFLNSGDTFNNINLVDIANKLIFDVEVFNINCVDSKNNHLKFRGLSLNLEDLRKRPSVPHQSTFIKKDLFLQKYNTSYKYLADYDFFCRLYMDGYVFNFHENIFLSNFECEGVTSNFQTALRVANEMKIIQNKYFKKSNYFIYLQAVLKYALFLFFGISNINNLRKK